LTNIIALKTELDRASVPAQWPRDFASNGVLLLYEALGCEACRAGYKGRVGVSCSAEGRRFRSRATPPQNVVAARAGRMPLLRQDAIEQTLRGTRDRASARLATHSSLGSSYPNVQKPALSSSTVESTINKVVSRRFEKRAADAMAGADRAPPPPNAHPDAQWNAA